MKRSTLTAIGIAAAASLALAGCGGDSPPAEPDEPDTTMEAPEPVTLTMSGAVPAARSGMICVS